MNASVRLSDFYNAAAGSTIGLHRRTRNRTRSHPR